MTSDTNGERRLLWKALNVLCVILLTATLAVTGWTLTQVVGLKVEVACIAAGQKNIAARLSRIETSIDAGGKVAEVRHEHQ